LPHSTPLPPAPPLPPPPLQLSATEAARDSLQQELAATQQQAEELGEALEAARLDGQSVAGQRDAWMASFQEAHAKMQVGRAGGRGGAARASMELS